MPDNTESNRQLVQLLTIDPAHYARQITLVEIDRFKAISPAELKSLKWTGHEKEKYAPNIVASTRWFNQINFWVQKEILMCDDITIRVNVLSHFICIAEQLIHLNNLYSAMAIMSALQTECIYRLKHTWLRLPSNHKQVYRGLESLFSQKNNCYKLREYTKNLPLPSIPYLGMYLSDLTYTNIAHPKESGRPSPIWLKKIDAIIEPISYFQKSVFPFTKNETIYSYLMSQVYLDSLQRFVEADNYKLSLKLEPKINNKSSSDSSKTMKNTSSFDTFKHASFNKAGTNHCARNRSFDNGGAQSLKTFNPSLGFNEELDPKLINDSSKTSTFASDESMDSTKIKDKLFFKDSADELDDIESKIYKNPKTLDDMSPTVIKKNFQNSSPNQDSDDYPNGTIKPSLPLKKSPDEPVTTTTPTATTATTTLNLDSNLICSNCKCHMQAPLSSGERVERIIRTSTDSTTDTHDFSFDTNDDRSRRFSEDFPSNPRTVLKGEDFAENVNRTILLSCIHAHLMTDNKYPSESFNIKILYEGWVKRRSLPHKHHATTCIKKNSSEIHNQIIPSQSASPTASSNSRAMLQKSHENGLKQKAGTISSFHSKSFTENKVKPPIEPNMRSTSNSGSSTRRLTLSSIFSGRIFHKNRVSQEESQLKSPFKIRSTVDSDDTNDSIEDLNELFSKISTPGTNKDSKSKIMRRKSSFLKQICKTINSNSIGGQSPSIGTEKLSVANQWKSAWAILVVMTPDKNNSSSSLANKYDRKKHQRTISNVSNWTEPSLNEENLCESENGPSNSQSISSNNFPSLFDAQTSLVYLVFFPKAKSKVLDLQKCYLQCLSRSLSHPIAKVHHAIHKNGTLDNSSFVISSRLKADQQTPNIVRIRPILRNTGNHHNQSGNFSDSFHPHRTPWTKSLFNSLSGDASISYSNNPDSTACRSPVKQIKHLANSLNCTGKQTFDSVNNSHHPSSTTTNHTPTTTPNNLSTLGRQEEQALLVEDWLSAIRKALLM